MNCRNLSSGKILFQYALLILCHFLIAACNPNGEHMPLSETRSQGGAEKGQDTSGQSSGPYFTTDILPLIQKNCGACHGPGSGRDWTDYETLKSKKESLKVRVLGPAANMPIGRKMDPKELSILQAWLDSGMAYAPSASSTPIAEPAPTPAPGSTNPPVATNPEPTPEPTPNPVAVPTQVQSCLGCHGESGRSQVPMFPKLAAQTAEYLSVQLIAFRDKTRANEEAQAYMWPAVQSLSDEDISVISNYFSTQSSGSQNPAGDEMKIKAGLEIFKNGIPGKGVMACSLCHGAEGQGIATMPRLAGQHAAYLMKQLGYFKSEQRVDGGTMTGIAKLMSDEEIENVSEYLNSL